MWTELSGDGAAHEDTDNLNCPPEPPISSSPAPDSSSPTLVWDLTDVHSGSSTSDSSPLDNGVASTTLTARTNSHGDNDDFSRRLDELLFAVLRQRAEGDLKPSSDNLDCASQRGSHTSEDELQRDSPSALPGALFSPSHTKLFRTYDEPRSRISHDSKGHWHSPSLWTSSAITSNLRRSSGGLDGSPFACGGSDTSPTITTIETEEASMDSPAFASPSPSATAKISGTFQSDEKRSKRDPNSTTKGYRLIRRPESYLAERRLRALENRREALRTEWRRREADGLGMPRSTVSNKPKHSTAYKFPDLDSYSNSSTTTRNDNLSQKVNIWRNNSASSEPPSKKPKLSSSFRTDTKGTAYRTRVGFAFRPASLRRAESLRLDHQHTDGDKESLYDGMKAHIFIPLVTYDPDHGY